MSADKRTSSLDADGDDNRDVRAFLYGSFASVHSLSSLEGPLDAPPAPRPLTPELASLLSVAAPAPPSFRCSMSRAARSAPTRSKIYSRRASAPLAAPASTGSLNSSTSWAL